jgi:hypothetical protein
LAALFTSQCKVCHWDQSWKLMSAPHRNVYSDGNVLHSARCCSKRLAFSWKDRNPSTRWNTNKFSLTREEKKKTTKSTWWYLRSKSRTKNVQTTYNLKEREYKSVNYRYHCVSFTVKPRLSQQGAFIESAATIVIYITKDNLHFSSVLKHFTPLIDISRTRSCSDCSYQATSWRERREERKHKSTGSQWADVTGSPLPEHGLVPLSRLRLPAPARSRCVCWSLAEEALVPHRLPRVEPGGREL